MRERNSLNLGDEIKIETNKGVISGRIKGVYLSGGINTGDIYKENVEFAERSSYLVKAKMGNFIDNITNSSIIAISDVGDGIASNVTGFLKVFKILSIISIVGTIIFNVNMVYMNCEKDEKDEEVLIALGFKRSFIINVQIIKGGLVMIFSSILSLVIYALIIKIFFKMMIKSNSEISGEIIVINLILAIIISIISFNLPIRKVKKKERI